MTECSYRSLYSQCKGDVISVIIWKYSRRKSNLCISHTTSALAIEDATFDFLIKHVEIIGVEL